MSHPVESLGKPYEDISCSKNIRMTETSLNHGSDNRGTSRCAGMELPTHVWRSEEALPEVNAFVEKRKPDFNQYRTRNEQMSVDYLKGVDRSDETELKQAVRWDSRQ